MANDYDPLQAIIDGYQANNPSIGFEAVIGQPPRSPDEEEYQPDAEQPYALQPPPPPTPAVNLDELQAGLKETHQRLKAGSMSAPRAAWERGMRSMGSLYALGGAALGQGIESFAPETGKALREWGVGKSEELERESEMYREGRVTQLEDIGSIGDVGEFVVSALGETAPSILESIGAAVIGGVVGSAVPGAGTAAGAATGAVAKGAAKGFLRKYLDQEVKKQVAQGVARETAEQAARRVVGRNVGATMAVFGSSYLQGVGDIYGETLDDEQKGNLFSSFVGAVPYAALDSIVEISAAKNLLRGSPGDKALQRYTKAVFGTAVKEGTTEALQEALLLGAGLAEGKEYTWQEAVSRLGNSWAIGAVAGGVMGAPGGRRGADEPKTLGDVVADSVPGDDAKAGGEQTAADTIYGIPRDTLREAFTTNSMHQAERARAMAAAERAFMESGNAEIASALHDSFADALAAQDVVRPTQWMTENVLEGEWEPAQKRLGQERQALERPIIEGNVIEQQLPATAPTTKSASPAIIGQVEPTGEAGREGGSEVPVRASDDARAGGVDEDSPQIDIGGYAWVDGRTDAGEPDGNVARQGLLGGQRQPPGKKEEGGSRAEKEVAQQIREDAGRVQAPGGPTGQQREDQGREDLQQPAEEGGQAADEAAQAEVEEKQNGLRMRGETEEGEGVGEETAGQAVDVRAVWKGGTGTGALTTEERRAASKAAGLKGRVAIKLGKNLTDAEVEALRSHVRQQARPDVVVPEPPGDAEAALRQPGVGGAAKPRKTTADRQIDPAKDDILAAIAKAGGLNRQEAEAQGIDPANFSRRGFRIYRVFTKNGDSFDGMAERLAQYGYQVAAPGERYSANAFLDSLSASLRGADVRTPDGFMGTMEAKARDNAMLQEDFAAIEEFAEEQQTDANVVSFGDLLALAEATLGEAETRQLVERMAVSMPNATESELLAAFEQEIENARASKEGIRVPETGESFSLTEETEQDIRNREEAERAEQEKLKADDQKRKADEDRAGFVLSGSTREVDEREARGQKNLLDEMEPAQSAAQQETPQTTDEPATNKNATKLRDAGKKLELSGEEDFGRDRLANTAKRARQAASAEDDARQKILIGRTMQNVADAMDAGDAPLLHGVGTKVAVEALESRLRQAMYARDRKEFKPHELRAREGRPPEDADIGHAELPAVIMHDMHAKNISATLKGKRGYADVARWADGKGGEYYTLRSQSDIDMARRAVAGMKKHGGDAWVIKALAGDILALDRFAKLGITSDEQLQATLREYMPLRDGQPKKDPIKEAERALVGQKVGIDFFPTPKPLAARMAEMAGVKQGMSVLEPSAGNGNLADAARDAGGAVDTVESSDKLRDVLKAKGHNIVAHDFMDFAPDKQYDAIIMNPPFSKRMDMEHIQRAYEMLKPGGALVAITGEGVHFGGDKKATAFRAWLDEVGAEVEKLPPNTFKGADLQAQTGVASRIVTIRKKQGGEPHRSRASPTPFGRVPEGKKPRGIPVADVQRVADSAGSRLLGKSGSRVGVRVVAKQSDAFGVASYGRGGLIRGAYDPSTNTVVLVAENLSSATEARQVLRHEIRGHVGWQLLQESDRAEFAERVLAATESNRWLRDLRSEVEAAEGTNASPELIAEEVFARVAESGRTALGRAWDRMLAWVAGKLRAMGLDWISDDVAQLRIMQEDLGAAIRAGREAWAVGTETRFSPGSTVTPEMDREHMAAVERGDMETAQRLVDEAARAEGYTVPAYHWTSGEFNAFDEVASEGFIHFGTEQAALDRARGQDRIDYEIEKDEDGFWVYPDNGPDDGDGQGPFPTRKEAEAYIKSAPKKIKPIAGLLNIKNPLRVPDFGRWTLEGVRTYLSDKDIITDSDAEAIWQASRQSDAAGIAEMRRVLADIGYDGFVYENEQEDPGSDSFAFQGPEQIKRRDPITSDDSGNVIPLSRRFNPRNEDIRYSRIGEDMTAFGQGLIDKVSSAFKDRPKGKNLGFWNRTVGTPFHLAKKFPETFGRFFDQLQAYNHDAARLAIEGESLAPGLFADLEKGLMQSLRSATKVMRNTRAKRILPVANAINEGTLDEHIWTDAELEKRGLDAVQRGLYREALRSAHHALDSTAQTFQVSALRALLNTFYSDPTATKAQRRAQREKIKGISESIQGRNVAETADAAEAVAEPIAAFLRDGIAEANGLLKDSRKELDEAKKAKDEQRIEQAEQTVKHLNDRIAANTKSLLKIEDTIKSIEKIAERVQDLKSKGYFPLMRFGRFTVTVRRPVTDPDTGETKNEVVWFSKHETEADQKAAYDALSEKLADDEEIKLGTSNEEEWTLFQGLNMHTLELFADSIDTSDEVGKQHHSLIQEYIRLGTAEHNALKSTLHRKGTAGYSDDMQRVLASYLVSNGRLAASNLHQGDVLHAITDIPQSDGDLREYATKLHNYLRQPTEEFSGVRQAMFVWYLGGSAASALVNLSQVPMVTYPTLSARGGISGAAGAIGRAYKKVMRGDMRAPDSDTTAFAKAVRKAREDAILAPQQLYELQATSRGGGLGVSKILNNPLTSFARNVWGAGFAAAEQLNREVTFAAAWDIAKAKGDSDKAAYDYAVDMVNQTQYVYNRTNRAQWGRGIGAPLMTFKSFTIQTLELWSRLPPKEKILMGSLLFAAAGLTGLPGEEDAEDLIDTIAKLFFGKAFETRKALEDAVYGALGETVGEMVLRGALAHGPADIGSRLGLGNLFPGTRALMPGNVADARDVAEVFGPISGIAKDLATGLEAAGARDWSRAGYALLPRAIKNAVDGAVALEGGEAVDKRGREITDVTPIESLFKLAGFNPTKVARLQEDKWRLMNRDQYRKSMESAMANRLARAMRDHDRRAQMDVRREIVDWNQRNPQDRIVITSSQIKQRVRALNMLGTERFLKSMSPELREEAAKALQE